MSQLTQSADELEKLRQEYIEDARDGMAVEWDETSKPGSFGCHELLDRTSMMSDSVERFVLSHPACLRNKQWFALAHTAVDALNELYQQVGAEHV